MHSRFTFFAHSPALILIACKCGKRSESCHTDWLAAHINNQTQTESFLYDAGRAIQFLLNNFMHGKCSAANGFGSLVDAWMRMWIGTGMWDVGILLSLLDGSVNSTVEASGRLKWFCGRGIFIDTPRCPGSKSHIIASCECVCVEEYGFWAYPAMSCACTDH